MTDVVIDIEIFGRSYKIRVKGEEDQQYIQRLTSYVDQKMREIAVKSRSADATKIAVLAALNIADESFAAAKKLDQLDVELSRVEAEIESLETTLIKSDDHAFPDIA